MIDADELAEFDMLEAHITTKAGLERSHSGEIVDLFCPPTLPWQLNPSDDEGDAPIALFNDIYNADMFHWLWHHRLELVAAVRRLEYMRDHAVGSEWDMAYVKYLAGDALK